MTIINDRKIVLFSGAQMTTFLFPDLVHGVPVWPKLENQLEYLIGFVTTLIRLNPEFIGDNLESSKSYEVACIG